MAVTHTLSFSVRFLDHFSGAPVPDELPVRIESTFETPSARPGGAGRRHNDGTYRFLSLPAGAHRVLWRDPFERSQAGWARWEADPDVTVPMADPGTPVDVTLWPVAEANAPQSATGVRGKLVGPGTSGLTVRIRREGDSYDRFTRSDQAGEFLFLPPGRLPADTTTGLIPMEIEVLNPDSSPRTVSSWQDGVGGSVTAGVAFTLTPRSMSRILFRIA